MAQEINKQINPAATFAKNIRVYGGGSEMIVLNDIPSLGLRNVGVTITCHNGSVSAVKLYGSASGIDSEYVQITGLTTFTLSAGETKHGEVAANYNYLQLTLTGSFAVDVYLTACL